MHEIRPSRGVVRRAVSHVRGDRYRLAAHGTPRLPHRTRRSEPSPERSRMARADED